MHATTRFGRLIVLGVWLLLATGVQAQAKDAPATSKPVETLPCAVLGTGSTERSTSLCAELGKELGRKTVFVDDGRSVTRGEAVHIVQGDVAWTVVWLRDGRARAFTRVSATDAEGREVSFLARACRVLSREARQVDKECLRIEPNGGRRMRAAELAYPWVELKQCRARAIDVLDPWWTSKTTR